MPDLMVDAHTRLDTFLRRHRTQMWRIPYLVAYRAVRMFRGKGEVTLKDGGTRLEANDRVRVATAVPSACVTAMIREANVNWRDYAIVPGTTPFDNRLRKFMSARTNTIVIQNPSLFNLQGFINGIATSDEITNPIRHLLVVGHGNVEGRFKISLYPFGAESVVSYEDLEDAVKRKTLIMDLSLMMPRPVDASGPSVPQLRMFGCRIGDQAPYMKKFKEALGGKITLFAPKHILVGASVLSPPGEAAYMAYSFDIHVPAAVKDKAELVDMLMKKSKAGEFVREDGTAVPKTSWKEWVPNDPNKWPPDMLSEIRNDVTLPVFRVKSNAPRRFGHGKARHFYGNPPQLVPLSKDTGKDADRKKAVKAYLQRLHRFTDAHPFPEYVRFGYKTLDEFIEGWNWQFAYDQKKKMLSCDPIRDAYRIEQPISSVATNTLVMNYYPTRPVPRRFQRLVPINLVQVENTFYFGKY